MPIFVYRCECGNTFERLVARDATPPECPECGSATRKIPARPEHRPRRQARGRLPVTSPLPWRGTVAKGAEGMQREVKLRENIVTKGREYPGNPGSTAAAPSTD